MHLLVEDNQKYINIDKRINSLFETAVTLCFEGVDLEEDFEVNIFLVEDEEIRNINKENRNIDKSTDVLSFPLAEFEKGKLMYDIYDKNPETDSIILGDIVISTQTVLIQAKEYGHSIERELIFLLTHGMLHILGYDHMNEEDERDMIQKQETVLSKLQLERGKSL